MIAPATFWSETPVERDARIRQQTEDRANCFNDEMEPVYSDDVDGVFAELLRLHGIVKDERTQELLNRLFGNRVVGIHRS